MWLSGFALIFLIFFLPETSANNILYRRTARLRKLTGDDKLKCEPELEGETMSPMDIVKMTLIRPITLNFLEPIVFLLNLYIALIYALLYCWFESFPIVFNEIYGWPLQTGGLAYLGILIGCFITLIGFFAYVYYIQEPQFDEDGNIQPEKRLPAACVGGFFSMFILYLLTTYLCYSHMLTTRSSSLHVHVRLDSSILDPLDRPHHRLRLLRRRFIPPLPSRPQLPPGRLPTVRRVRSCWQRLHALLLWCCVPHLCGRNV